MLGNTLLFKIHVTTVPLAATGKICEERVSALSTMARRGWELATTTSFVKPDEPYGPGREETDVVVIVDTLRWAGDSPDAVYPDSHDERVEYTERVHWLNERDYRKELATLRVDSPRERVGKDAS